MSISGRAVQVSNMRLHGYDLEGFSQGCESFQQLHRKGRGKLGLGWSRGRTACQNGAPSSARQMNRRNFTAGIAMKSARGLKDGSKMNWIPGVNVRFGVTARFQ